MTMGSSSVLQLGSSGGNMTFKACAACKYQRRQCTPECILAPYFPGDQPKTFLNVHKLFGISNVIKILKMLEPSKKKIAMDSVIVQANCREKYPVHGCWGEICRLQNQIKMVEEELHVVHQQLKMCKQQQQQHHKHDQDTSLHDDVASQLELGMAPHTNKNISQKHSYSNSSNSMDYSPLLMDSKDNNTTNPLWLQYLYLKNKSKSMAMKTRNLSCCLWNFTFSCLLFWAAFLYFWYSQF